MRRELHLFALWAVAILTVATAAILYQHATHTGSILAMLGGLGDGDNMGTRGMGAATADPAATVSDNPTLYGASSRATGVWTPIGPMSAQTGALASPFYERLSMNGNIH